VRNERHRRIAAAEGGSTLIEVMIVVAIFGLIVAGVMSVLKTANDNMAVDIPQGDMENIGHRLVEQIERMVRPSAATQITLPGGDGHAIQYMVPVDHDGDGDVLDDTFTIEWGAFEQGVPTLGNFMIYQFVPAAGANGTFTESANGIDANRDGDLGDVFRRGYIEFETEDGWSRLFGEPNLVCVNNAGWGGDVNGDGTADPIFDLQGNRLTISIWLMRIVGDGEPVLVNVRSTVFLRN